ncbi:uncharacterized protein LOC127880945 [Dreissena polymorpha]|nr:uncharacterized protein LOC127879705 [Dreissena polymorpha]XP_052284421.1 uncharacterized protein LOC127880945 [Dreissena polymorpha]
MAEPDPVTEKKVQQYTTLYAKDVPGAVLPQLQPERCKVTELRIWLKCRGQAVKSNETKAELCLRVKKFSDNQDNILIVDPYPDQPFAAKQKSSCMNCQGQSTVSTAEEHLNLEECTWTQSTRPIFKDFSYMNILEWTKSSGKGSKLGVEKPIQRGYVFFHDGYVFDTWTSERNSSTIVRCKCFRSMKNR